VVVIAIARHWLLSCLQALCMVVISLAETRHDAAACLEALAEAGLKNLADPALRDAFTSRRISTLLWVRPASLGLPTRATAGRRPPVLSARAAALKRPWWCGCTRMEQRAYRAPGWLWLWRPEPGALVQAYARLNRVDAGAGRRLARALAELAVRPGALGSNAQALGNVAWGLSVARLLDAPTLQRVRRRPGGLCCGFRGAPTAGVELLFSAIFAPLLSRASGCGRAVQSRHGAAACARPRARAIS